MIHALAWIAWLAASLVALSTTRNPLYLILVILCLAVVASVLGSERKELPVSLSPFKIGLVAIALSSLFNFMTAHFGDTVLFELPRSIPFLGGAYTLEALAFGVLNGLVLAGVLASFAVLNLALPVSAFVRLVPRAFYSSAIIVSIALTFIPNTLRQLQEIREAQAVRGHRVRGLRDWVPLFIPLLVGGLEKAFQLGEAMTARGFASGQDERHGHLSRLILAAGLLMTLTGWLLRWMWQRDLVGNALLLFGLLSLAGAMWWLSKSVPHTTYHQQRWAWTDTLVAAAAAITILALVLPLPGMDRETLLYYPYPKLSLPGFDPLLGLGLMGMLGPALVVLVSGQADPEGDA